jgi:hypothetical protein
MAHFMVPPAQNVVWGSLTLYSPALDPTSHAANAAGRVVISAILGDVDRSLHLASNAPLGGRMLKTRSDLGLPPRCDAECRDI